MHLINAKTYELEYFVGANIPHYAILSHVWGQEEVSFQDLQQLETARSKKGFAKIQLTCHQALRDGLLYAWVDTCCINKESSAELSEAITSMFRWYARAAKCYAYLSDVKVVGRDGFNVQTQPPLAHSKWFTRGWTLQELIAPPDVTFMDRDWTTIGVKRSHLLKELSSVTGVDEMVLEESSSMFRLSIAKRMSWAAKRQTTRKEDEAYCLLGIFGVSIPMLYGEEEGAFVRLQEELIRKSTDHSVFVHAENSGTLLATSPSDFAGRSDIALCQGALIDNPYELTNGGLRITLPVFASASESRKAVLNCHRNGRRLVLRLGKIALGNTTISFPLATATDETGIETLLACRVEDLFIFASPNPATLGPAMYQLPVFRLWVRTTTGAKDLQTTVRALEPPELWDIAAPMEERLLSRVGNSARLANFSLTLDTYSPGIGSITIDVDDGGAKPIVFTARFQRRQSPLEQYVGCHSMELYETDEIGIWERELFSHPSDSCLKDHELQPGGSVQISLLAGVLRVTAVLRSISSNVKIPRGYGTAFLLDLRVDKVSEEPSN